MPELDQNLVSALHVFHSSAYSVNLHASATAYFRDFRRRSGGDQVGYRTRVDQKQLWRGITNLGRNQQLVPEAKDRRVRLHLRRDVAVFWARILDGGLGSGCLFGRLRVRRLLSLAVFGSV